MLIPFESLQADIQEIEQQVLLSLTPLDNVDPEGYPGCDTVAELNVIVCGKPAVFTVGFPEQFPYELPRFYDKKNVFGRIPHKTDDGFLCFTRNESLIIDHRFPGSILLNCLDKVVEIIEAGLKKENESDFSKEFEVYWFNKKSTRFYASIDTHNKNVRELDLWVKDLGKQVFVVCHEKGTHSEKTIEQIFHIDLNGALKYRCVYFPLQEGTLLIPPTESKQWDYSTFKKNTLENLTNENRKIFTKLISKPVGNVKPGLEFIISGIPLDNGHTALFGAYIVGNSIQTKYSKTHKNKRIQPHPFSMKPKKDGIEKAPIERWHPNHLLNRTGGNTELTDKHILIAGVGSVGSEVANRLAKAGIGKLSLVDRDLMKLDNVHRHSLGVDQVYTTEDGFLLNKPKVLGMKEELNRKFPFTEIKTYFSSIFTVLEELDIRDTIDLLIVAIGSPSTEILINQTLHYLENPPPTLYTWVEPLGIGGHTLVTLNQNREGCYQCLFQPDAEGQPIKNQSAFAEAGQEFAKSITGCGSVFTPYNFLDSERSAMLTVEAALKILTGELSGNPILSWKGDDRLFNEGGFITRKRYSFSSEKLDETKYLYKDDRCPVCSEGRDLHPNSGKERSLSFTSQ
ncbi:ThiF family adenylyltransferase [Fictibacillus enclensis]|uniref:ThiF family adenylyltransferase n=1 Tax=Fictibacillus enclensis TaxID=1017270 RepID=UPI0025A205CA|nr:ThiF family adenylyltransferase [Fictibacillus enclensis]MDM5196529.1 ThiF family adenylyltransferase [Fictibacillus enclensis]